MIESIRITRATPMHALGHQHPTRVSAASGAHYTCTMHPEIVRDAPGGCPKSGMTLVPV